MKNKLVLMMSLLLVLSYGMTGCSNDEDSIIDGIYIHQPPLWEKEALFYKCNNMLKKFPFIKSQQIFIKKWGREVPILSNHFIGQMYAIRLK